MKKLSKYRIQQEAKKINFWLLSGNKYTLGNTIINRGNCKDLKDIKLLNNIIEFNLLKYKKIITPLKNKSIFFFTQDINKIIYNKKDTSLTPEVIGWKRLQKNNSEYIVALTIIKNNINSFASCPVECIFKLDKHGIVKDLVSIEFDEYGYFKNLDDFLFLKIFTGYDKNHIYDISNNENLINIIEKKFKINIKKLNFNIKENNLKLLLNFKNIKNSNLKGMIKCIKNLQINLKLIENRTEILITCELLYLNPSLWNTNNFEITKNIYSEQEYFISDIVCENFQILTVNNKTNFNGSIVYHLCSFKNNEPILNNKGLMIKI